MSKSGRTRKTPDRYTDDLDESEDDFDDAGVYPITTMHYFFVFIMFYLFDPYKRRE